MLRKIPLRRLELFLIEIEQRLLRRRFDAPAVTVGDARKRTLALRFAQLVHLVDESRLGAIGENESGEKAGELVEVRSFRHRRCHHAACQSTDEFLQHILQCDHHVRRAEEWSAGPPWHEHGLGRAFRKQNIHVGVGRHDSACFRLGLFVLLPAHGTEHIENGLGVLRPILGVGLQHPLDGLDEDRAAARRDDLQSLRDGVRFVVVDAGEAVRGRSRRSAHDTMVHGRAQGIDIRPGSLLVALAVLLEGRVTRRQHDGHRRALLLERAPRGTEVQQHRGARFTQENVRRLDVAMQVLLRVNDAQALENGHDDVPNLGFIQGHDALQMSGQRLAVLVVHDQIRGSVGLQELGDAYDAGLAELGEHAALVQKALQPVLVGVTVGLGSKVQRGAVGAAKSQA